MHSTTAPWQLVVFTSDNVRYLTLVQRDWWWYRSDWTCERFHFCLHQGLNWGPALYHWTIVTSSFHLWQFQVFNSDVEGLGWYCSDWMCERFSFCLHWGLKWRPVHYHCSMVTCGFHLWQFEVFNSGAEGLVVVLFWLDLWEIFFCPHRGLKWGPLDL